MHLHQAASPAATSATQQTPFEAKSKNNKQNKNENKKKTATGKSIVEIAQQK